MSIVGGVFSESVLHALRAKADEMMFDDRIKQQFIPNFDVLKAVKAVQTADFRVLTEKIKSGHGGDKEYDIEMMWQNFCDITAAECAGECDWDTNESSTNTQTYSLSFCKEVGYAIDEYNFVDNEFDYMEAVAKAKIKADVELINSSAAYAVAVLNLNKGVNEYASGIGDVSGTDTYILPAYWNAAMVAYLNTVATVNKFTSPVIASGQNLYEPVLIAKANSGNEGQRGDAQLFNMFPFYFDLFNIDTVNGGVLYTYMLSMGSLAMASRAYNPTNMQVINGVFVEREAYHRMEIMGLRERQDS